MRAKAEAAGTPRPNPDQEESVFGLAEETQQHEPAPRRRRPPAHKEPKQAAPEISPPRARNAKVRQSGLKQPSRLMQPRAGKNRVKATEPEPEPEWTQPLSRRPRSARSARESPRSQVGIVRGDMFNSVCSDGFGAIDIPEAYDEPEPEPEPPQQQQQQQQQQQRAYQPGWGHNAETEEQRRRDKQRQYQVLHCC